MYDVVVVGAGVSGCAVARELARYRASVCVVERADDVCCGISKANSAIIHAGFDAMPGSLMAKLNVEGNRLMYEWARELEVAALPIGSLVVCVSEDTRPGLEELVRRGAANGVEGLRIIERDELLEMEPHIADEAVCALWAPTGGIVDPFGLTVALAENAAANGVDFVFDAELDGIRRIDGGWELACGTRAIEARAVVNAAGVYADVVHGLFLDASANVPGQEGEQAAQGIPVVSRAPIHITARKGEYYLLDTTAAQHVRHTVFMLPGAMGKGVLVSPTVHGNLIVGPTATDVDDKEATQTTAEGLAELRAKCSLTVRDVPLREVITTFAGLRAHQEAHDFVIGELEGACGLFDVAAIESPGLTSAPAIGVMVSRMVAQRLGLQAKGAGEFDPHRPGVTNLNLVSWDEWDELCQQDPAWGSIVCRCCRVSEAQVVDVMHRSPAARSIDAIKRRTGVTMGRCQGGFCTPKILELMERELGLSPEEVTMRGPGSALVVGRTKDRTPGTGAIAREADA
jgi:glycerol-3-phosphate dehydrogenase